MAAKKPDVVIAGGVGVRPNTLVYCVDNRARSISVGRVQKWDVGMVIVFPKGTNSSMGAKFNIEDVFATHESAVDAIVTKFGTYVP